MSMLTEAEAGNLERDSNENTQSKEHEETAWSGGVGEQREIAD